MSADNWTKCPKCFEELVKEYEALRLRVKKEYGKIPVEEWEILAIKSKKPLQTENAVSLREDFDIGMDKNGTFSIGYCCKCNQCGFGFDYKFDTEVEY